MSHAILGTRIAKQDGRKAFWHEILGAILQPKTSVSEGLGLIDGHFFYEKAPLYTEAFGDIIEVPDQYALVRPALKDDPQVRFAGIVGKDYELVQHGEFAVLLDPLVDQGWTVESMGILHDGAQLFVCFHAGAYVVNGDDVLDYWVASEYKAQTSFEVFNTPMRTECANTYTLGKSKALQQLRIPHFRGARQELEFALQVVAAAEMHKAEFKASLEAMGRMSLLERQVNEILERTYLDPPPTRFMRLVDEQLSQGNSFQHLPGELKFKYSQEEAKWRTSADVVARTRDAAYERYDVFNQRHSSYAGTAWALWNGITEVENFKNGKQRGISGLWGSRAETMQRAYSVLLESVN